MSVAPGPAARGAGEGLPRLFVAVDLPAALRRALAAGMPSGAGVRRVREEDLHLTLHYLGPAETGIFREALAGVSAPRFSLVLTGTSLVRRSRGGTILWMEVSPDEALLELWHLTGQALAGTGRFTPDPRPFRPHITLARNPGPGLPVEEESPNHALSEACRAAVPVESFSLYASREGGECPRYRCAATFRLGGG